MAGACPAPYNPGPVSFLFERHVDLKLPIKIIDELAESVIESTGVLDLASGEIRDVKLSEDNDPPYEGFPGEDEDYEFTSGMLTNGKKEVEFRVEVDVVGRKYSVTPSELLELKGRAARLFSAAPSAPPAPPAPPPKGRRKS
ncbi:hypothetical protein GCM10009107_25240 [Ideonella azotifigens]|uniref:Uncharacterized protein n=1 Tax=Ideonella azotifigens TaxID=513160 RepID=A0ABP3VAH4_9BURK